MAYKTRLELVERLGQVAARLARATDRDGLVQALSDILRTDLSVDWFGFYFVDPATGRPLAAGGELASAAVDAESPAAWVCGHKKPLLQAGDEAAAAFRKLAPASAPAAASLLHLPMLDGEECVGALGLADRRPNRFGDIEVALASFVLRQAAAMHRNLLDAESREKRQRELAAINRALAESEERFKLLTENSHDVIMLFDRGLRHLYVNSVVKEQTGIDAAEFIGKTHAELGFPEPLVRQWEDALRKVFQTNQPQRDEFQLPSGSWIDWLLMPQRGPDGETVTVVTSARDITERRQVENLARAQRDLQAAMDAAPNLAAAMRAALATLLAASGLDAGGFYLVDEKLDLRLVAHQGISEDFTSKFSFLSPGPPDGPLIGSRQPTYPPISALPPPIADLIRRHGIRAVAIDPVWHEGRAVACVVAASRRAEEIAPAARHALEALALQTGAFVAKRRAEEALRQSTEFLKKLIDNLPVAVFGKDAAGRFSVWNKASEQFYGIATADVLGKNDYDFFPKDQADFFVLKDRETFARGETVDIPEEPINSLNRGRRTIHTIKVPIYDERGRPDTLLGISEDITERNAALAALQFREKFAKLLMNLSTQFINLSAAEIDAGVNDALAAIGRFSEADRALVMLLDDAGAALAVTNEWCAPNVVSGAEEARPLILADNPLFREALRDLRIVHVPSVAAMISTAAPEKAVLDRRKVRSGIVAPIAYGDKALGLVAFERVREERGWDDDSVDLLRVVGVMFANALARKRIENELREAKRAAEAAACAKGDFLATMSHEIRTPLSGIVGMLNLLDETPLAEEQRNYVRMATVSADSLIRIVNDVLDFAKVEAGKLRLESRATNLESELFEVSGFFRAKAELKGLTLLVMYDPRAPREVFCDRLRLRQVLTNLLDNAIKFTDAGRIVVQADCISRRRELATFRISVTDTGVGVPLEQQAAIFEPFTQVDGSAARRHGGAGLGLSIAKQLVEMMKGEIRLESAPGRGATFSVTLPLAIPKSAFTTVHGDAVLPAIERGAAPAGAARRILLAEDNSINQFAATALLEKLGCQVVGVEDGARAAALAASERFDAIFMDVQMPGIDGYEAARQIRALPGPAGQTPIIALTANAMGGDREKCLAAGMNDYLSKPVMKSDLQRLLNRWAPIVAAAPAAAEVDTGVFDVPAALARFNGDLPLLRDLVDLFLNQAPSRTENIAQSIAVMDFPTLRQIAHSVKGGSSYISAARVTDAALRLERAAEAADIALARAVFAELRGEVERLRAAANAAFAR